MSLSSRVIAVKIIGLLCVFGFALSIKAQSINSANENGISENVLYAYVFESAAEFEKQSAKLSDEETKTFFGNYYKRNADLNDDQNRILKKIARDFVNAASVAVPYQKLNISPQYRDILRDSFGKIAFRKFDKYIKEKFASTLSIIRSGVFLSIGSSYISLRESQHELRGYAYTLVYTLAPDSAAPPPSCSVSATMTGPGVSESGSASQQECMTNPEVSMTSVNYQSNAQYTVTASHSIGMQTGSSQASLMTSPSLTITNPIVQGDLSGHFSISSSRC